MKRLLPPAIALVMLFVGVSQAPADESPSPTTAAAADAPVIAATGDMVCNRGPKEGPIRNIEKYGLCEYMTVSDLVVDGDYDAFFALGDLQYLRGSLEKFRTFYDESYGRVKDITVPVPGNHEYYTRTDGMWGAGYYTYFGKAAHPPNGYYSQDIGDWHVITLNTQLCKEKSWLPRFGMIHGLPGDGCRPGDPQYEWLQRDLASHPNSEYACTMAVMHHPLFKWSYWPLRKTDRVQRPLWRLLMRAGADVALAGHQHDYQRFEPLNTRGELSDKGMAQFISGLGGDTYQQIAKEGAWNYQPKPTGLAAVQGSSYGILEMTLNPEGYDFRFVTAEGQEPFEDSGSADCH